MCSKDLTAKIGLEADKLRKPCDDCVFPLLANFIHPWRLMFESLLSQIDLDDIDKENYSEEEKRISALRKWKARNGHGATYEVLVDTLLSKGKMDQAECVCHLLIRQLSQQGAVHEQTISKATGCDAKESESIIEFHCPCGECSLETYLQKGCSESCIPYLGMTTLSKGDQENLNYILKKDTKKIMRSFADLSNKTCDSLVQQGVTIEKLVRVAANFNTSLHDHLMKLKSTDLVFATLATEMSFFNHEILANIIEELGDKDDKKRLMDYSKEFKKFCKRKIFEVEPGHCACGQILSRLKGRKLFAVVLPLGEKTIMNKLGDAVNIKEMLADILDVLPAALHLHRIDRGSVILVFSVPDCIAKKLFPLSNEKIALLRVNGMTLFVPQELRYESNQVEDIETFVDGTNAGKPAGKLLVKGNEAESVPLITYIKGASIRDMDCNCFVCQQVLRNPYLVLCCDSNFCLECINAIQAEGKPCPSCQQPHFDFVPNIKLRRFCQKMYFTCPYCKSFTSSFEDVQSSHWPKCPFVPISCPNMCSARPQRQNVEAHIENDCPSTLVDCDLKSETGCKIRLPRVDMFTHIITHVVPQSLQDALQRSWTWYKTLKVDSFHENLATFEAKGSGYECEFAEPVPSAFQTKCLICMEILREPYATSCCGKNFCLFCIRSIKNNNPCPHCQCPTYTLSDNKGLHQALIKLQVFCSNKEGGCPWKGELSQLENHLNLNPKLDDQMTGCPLAEIKCKYCSKMFKRNEIDEHQSDICTDHPLGLTQMTPGLDISHSVAYEYRAFLLQIAEKLSQEDKKKIIFLEGMSTDLDSKLSLAVLTQLEMRGKLSASKPDNLVKLLKKIDRIDLARKVKEFVKQQRKGRTTALSDFQALDNVAAKLSANLQVTLLQCEILLDQVENLKEAAEKMNVNRVEEVVSGAFTLISERLKPSLLHASKLIQEGSRAQEQTFYSDSYPPSPDLQLSSLDFEAESLTPAPPATSASQPAGCVRLPHAVDLTTMPDAGYEYRAFLLQIAEKLSQEDKKKIVFLEEMSTDLDSKPSPAVLTQLEMRGKLSASKPDDLVKLLKKIDRIDLARKVKEFVKQQRKGRTTALSDFQALDNAAAKLSASLQVTLLQCEILLDQVENLKEAAEKMNINRVEEVVSEAFTLISERLKPSLLHASKLIQEGSRAQEQTFYSDSYPPSPDLQLSSLDFEAESLTPAPPATSVSQPAGCVRLPHAVINTSELKAAVRNLIAQSSTPLPRTRGSPTKAQPTNASGNKQPLMPPSSPRQHVNNTPAPFHSSSLQRPSSPAAGPLPRASGDAGRHMVQGRKEQPRSGTTVTQLVTGRFKPTPPPKPKIGSNHKMKQGEDKDDAATTVATHTVAAQQQESKGDPDYDYLHTSSCTGDSGFADSREFLQVPLPGEYQLPQGVQYPPPGQQQVEGSADAQYYKSLQRDAIQEINYSPPVTTQVQYMNFQHKGRK